MPTRNVVLSDHQQHFIETLVSSGRYQNASEVLREGLRLVERQEQEDAARLQALRDAAFQGWGDLAAARFDELDDSQLAERIRALGAIAAERAATSA